MRWTAPLSRLGFSILFRDAQLVVNAVSDCLDLFFDAVTDPRSSHIAVCCQWIQMLPSLLLLRLHQRFQMQTLKQLYKSHQHWTSNRHLINRTSHFGCKIRHLVMLVVVFHRSCGNLTGSHVAQSNLLQTLFLRTDTERKIRTTKPCRQMVTSQRKIESIANGAINPKSSSLIRYTARVFRSHS